MTRSETYRNLILGAGPAGLQLAELFQRRGEPYLVLERGGGAGSFFEKYPRHGKLLSINKVYTGCPDLDSRLRYDWNSLLTDDESLQFSEFSSAYFPTAQELVRYLRAFAEKRALAVRYHAEVTSVAREEAGYRVRLGGGEELCCERLFVGTGVSRERVPAIEGAELCETYGEASTDPRDYTDQRVLIVGKGNSAFEVADNLIATTRKLWVCGKNTVRLAWATHFVGDLRATNNDFLDTYQLKAQNNILDGELTKVVQRGDELVATLYFESRERSYDFPCDRVLLCAGFVFDDSIFAEECKPEMTCGEKVPAVTSSWESTAAPNMFFIGTLMQARDFRKTMSAFIHGFRHNILALDRMLERRDGGAWWRDSRVLGDAEAVAERAIERFSTSAGMLLQPGFLADVVGIDSDGAIRYAEDVPVTYAHEHLSPGFVRMLTLTLEYKEHDGSLDPFAMPRGLGVKEDFYLHPVILIFEGGELVERGFLPDDLDNDWRLDPEHLAKLVPLMERFVKDGEVSSLGRGAQDGVEHVAD